jgi:hypothetical protein
LQYFFCVNFHGIQSRHWGLTNNSQELGSWSGSKSDTSPANIGCLNGIIQNIIQNNG